MCIYNDHIPYTYLIGWSEHNKFYYGRRTAKDCHPNEFWVTYFTSSKEVKKFRKEHGEPDIIQIRKTFPDNPRACSLWEHKFLTKINAQHNPNFLNKRNSDYKWDRTGLIIAKDKDGNTFSVTKDDPRYLSGELVSVTVGKVSVKDKDGNTLSVSKDDPRYLSGELVGIAKGKVSVKDTDGNTLSVSKDDPRYLSGELVSLRTGLIIAKDKDGNTFSVTKDDPRYLSGELVGVAKGKATVRDKDGNTFYVSKDDPRYLSGELVSIRAGVAVTHGYTNEYRKTNGYKTIPGKPRGSKEKEETKTKKSNARKGKTTVRDKDGNCFLVDVNDPKFISGEYVSVMAGVGKGRKLSQETKDKLKRPKTKEHIEKYRLTTKNRPTFYCECCDVTIKGVPQWNKHMNSKKHMDKTIK